VRRANIDVTPNLVSFIESIDESQGLFSLVPPDFPRQNPAQKCHCLQRLPKIVTRRGEKA
jgi:hypothetical protein